MRLVVEDASATAGGREERYKCKRFKEMYKSGSKIKILDGEADGEKGQIRVEFLRCGKQLHLSIRFQCRTSMMPYCGRTAILCISVLHVRQALMYESMMCRCP